MLYFNIRQLSEAEKYNELAIEYVNKTDDVFVNFSAWQLGAGIKARNVAELVCKGKTLF